MARQVKNPQSALGTIHIKNIRLDYKSRDDIPKILAGLQHIYLNDSLRKSIFKLLETEMLPGIDKKNGRPGMELWKVFVLGILRVDLNCDYDRLHELANQHNTVRQMLGHSEWIDKSQYELQTIKDNVKLLTPELLDKINTLIVLEGHELVKKKGEEPALYGRCDSFVVKTNVHYPTDINLLFDAIRKVISAIAQICAHHGLSDWRQVKYILKKIKRYFRIAQKKKRYFGKNDAKKIAQEKEMQLAHKELIELCQGLLERAEQTLKSLMDNGLLTIKDAKFVDEIARFSKDVRRQIDQIDRRVLKGETIPHDEKVFSIFEPHTEWIVKGKAGVPVELGLRVCILEDQHQFILHSRVMQKETDDRVAVPMVADTKAKFANLTSCSFDKGFHSKENQEALKEYLDHVGLKRKGFLSQAAKAEENSEAFKRAQNKHSAVESAINALEVHGLDVCRDRGIDGFKRYVALAVVARNIHRIGDILYKKEAAKRGRQNSCNISMADRLTA